MAIEQIGGINFNTQPLSQSSANQATGNFADVLTNALGQIEQTDRADKIGNIEMLAGEGDTMHGVLIDAEKADLALNLTLQVRNKVVEAYNEVMRMQV